MQGENIINGIIGKTENEAIFMFILILVAIVIIALPIYKLSIERSKERQLCVPCDNVYQGAFPLCISVPAVIFHFLAFFTSFNA